MVRRFRIQPASSVGGLTGGALLASVLCAHAGCAPGPRFPRVSDDRASCTSSGPPRSASHGPESPHACSAPATPASEVTRAEAEAAVEAVTELDASSVDWLPVRAALEAALDADPYGASSARFRFLSILATANAIANDESSATLGELLARARARERELASCAGDSPYRALGALALGEMLFASGRAYEAFETFSRTAGEDTASEVFRARAAVRAAFIRVDIAVQENVPGVWTPDGYAAFLDGIARFVRVLGEALRASSSLDDSFLARTRQSTPRALIALVAQEMPDLGRVFPRLMDEVGLTPEETALVSFEVASVFDDGAAEGASAALDFLLAARTLDPSVPRACSETNLAPVRTYVCRARAAPNGGAMDFLRACAPDAPMECPPDAEADRTVAVRALEHFVQSVHYCIGCPPEDGRLPESPSLRFEVGADGAMRVSVDERIVATRVRQCVERAVDGFDAHGPHGILGAPVELRLWEPRARSRACGGDRTQNLVEGVPVDWRVLGGSGPRSVVIDDDLLATPTGAGD